ncbi:MAG: efflux RND transporter permease subunit, partial [Acidobacteriota bacterium]
EIAPPTIVGRALYTGATPEVIADTVATPIEQAVNGVEGMLYMTSSSTADGIMQLSVTFELGTDLDTAQILVQNRVATAEPRLPEEVRRLGLVTEKSSPSLMMVVHLLSPESTYDNLYISNYALLRVSDVLKRIGGVGNLTVFGAREYSMRVWLDPDRLAELSLTADDVVAALRAQNVQVAAGTLGQPPAPTDSAFQLTVNTQGRFQEAEQFAEVVVKSGDDGRLTRVRDVARVELGALDYVRNSYLNGQEAVGIGIFQRPGSNALATAEAIRDTMAELAADFPPGMEFRIAYDPTEFVEESVNAVYETLFEAVLLVILVIVLFLQSWRAALIPIAAIPVSLIGTFAVMSAVGFSLNTLSLFGLVLAIGIVVDDAIVVVENIERHLEDGLDPAEASRITMDEVGSALISMALVLVAVFVPAAFLGGISGQFFRQFALTIAAATVISAFNSLTLSPALGAVFLVPKDYDPEPGRIGRALRATLGSLLAAFFALFNRVFDRLRDLYARIIATLLRVPVLPLLIFVAMLAATAWFLRIVPGGFIPPQDQGYVIVAVELPKGASLDRTDAVVLEADRLIRDLPGVADVVTIAGFSGATFAAASNAGAMFVLLEPFEERAPGVTAWGLLPQIGGALSAIREASFFVIPPPPVQGLGTGGGFKM